ncbi:MAG: hypothetical protein Q4C06_04145 [Bacillota bacterium]|nr:hypothetical protein [Bacillota bacterium]
MIDFLKERSRKGVVLISILLVLLGGFSFLKGAELLEQTVLYSGTIETLDEKRGNVLGMTAALVGTSTLITGLPDDVGTPVAEQLIDMTDWLLLVLCVVFLEKYGLTMLWAGVFKVLLPLVFLLMIVDIAGFKWDVRQIWRKLLLLSLVLVLTIPLGVRASGMIEKTYDASIAVKADAGDELAQMMEAETEEKEGWLQQIFGKVKDSAEEKLEKAKEVLVRYTEQLAVMLVTSCLVPVAVLMFLFWVFKTVMGLDITLPKRRSLRLRRK